jgi:hypothetical protein
MASAVVWALLTYETEDWSCWRESRLLLLNACESDQMGERARAREGFQHGIFIDGMKAGSDWLVDDYDRE